jgi:pyrroloquinoline quinone biosynthesis protein E
MNKPPPPVGLLAELTHRCPLQCAYCSNPIALEKPKNELTTAQWCDLFDQAAALGVLQIHLSGGEPTARRDIVELVAHATGKGLYCNLITSGVGLRKGLMAELKNAGLRHVQVSVQDADFENGDILAGYPGAHVQKAALAQELKRLGLSLTLNAPVHRLNIARVGDAIALALTWGAHRIEVANVQYYGWGLANRARLMPTRDQVKAMIQTVRDARERLAGQLEFDVVMPDYYASRPKACMGGWGQRIITVAPNGTVLPCHAAQTLPGIAGENIRDTSLAALWSDGADFNLFRGTSWMKGPCQGCENAEVDWGGCRCQAMALLGDASATDPACRKSPDHAMMMALVEAESLTPEAPLRMRRPGG